LTGGNVGAVAQRREPGVWIIQGETVTLPVMITRARLTAAVFTAEPAAARQVLTGVPLEPLIVFGRVLSTLLIVHYHEFALRTYDEVGVGLLARGPDGRPGMHLVDLPVTGAFTREAGQDIWALPKWLMEAVLTFGTGHTEATVRHEGAEVLRARVRHGRLRLPCGVRGSLPVWSFADRGAQAGRLLRGRLPMRLSGVRVGRGDTDIRLGEHPMARRMRSLGMLGRPLLTVTAKRMSGPLGEFAAVPPGAPKPGRS
jgi:Acetoacetate decarboxylase (ADC)